MLKKLFFIFVQTQDVLDQLNWRYATKKFDKNKKLSLDQVKSLEESLILSPSSYGLQPWQFIIIENSEIKKQLMLYSWNQSQIEECSHLVVFCALKTVDETYIQKYIERIAEVRKIDISLLESFKKTMLKSIANKTPEELLQWSSYQVYIALGALLTTVAMLGIDSCPMGGIEPEKYNKTLDVSNDYSVLCVCALGYRSSDDINSKNPKVRFDKKDIIISK